MKPSDRLHIGCGRDIREGFINLDHIALPGVDVVHDLNVFPYPFADNTFVFVLADGILEHLDDVIRVMDELWRIARDGAIIEVLVPYFSSHLNYTDPTHKRAFTYDSFDYFVPGHRYSHYSKARFSVIRRRLIFSRARYAVLFGPLEFLVNLAPHVYQKFFSYLLPFNTLRFELRVIK